MSDPPFIPTFLPINRSNNTDTKNIPLMNTFRGDIVPATFDTSRNINNHPTPFYILCTAKIYNTRNAIPSLPDGTNVTYQQFGLTAGDSNIFPGKDSSQSNYAEKNQFTLTTFADVLGTTNVQDPTDPGLLVPVYCFQDPAVSVNNTLTPAFTFFRADVFWEGPPSQSYTDYINYLPPKPLPYKKFPTPYGKSVDNCYQLCSLYTPFIFDSDNNNRIGTWSLFATNQQLALLLGNAAAVSIAFSDPDNPLTNPSPYEYLNGVNILRTSTIYTVQSMNQYTGALVYWPLDYPDQQIITYNYNISGFGQYKGGYPLNFLYQVGSPNGYKKTQGNYQTYYQNSVSNYLGTVCQPNMPGQPQLCSGTKWNLQTISNYYEGGTGNFGVNPYAYTFSTGYGSYSCYCAGGENFNAACVQDRYLTSINDTSDATEYYAVACNSIHAGIYQYLAFQFIPIDFFNVPVKSFIPPIVSSLGQFEGPTGTQYYSEEGSPGEIGPVGVTGPSWTNDVTGAKEPGPPIGPTGAGDYIITYPYNGATGATNAWPDNVQPNRIVDNTLTQAISGWIQNPDVYVCPELISDQKYCMFQDYYHSLMGFFYNRPQDLNTSSECGRDYIPSEVNYETLQKTYPAGGCTGGDVCVPNYGYLADPGNLGIKPFYCQSPTGTNPYPESLNGFNNTNSYPIFNYNNIYLPDGYPQPQTGTPITWENLYSYQNIIPPAPPPSAQVSYKQVPYINALKLAQNNNVNQLTGKTQNEKGSSTLIIAIIVIIILVVVIIVIIVLYRSSTSKSLDVYNPNSSMFYQQVT
jgi:hypothetical protein